MTHYILVSFNLSDAFLDPEGVTQKTTILVLLVVVISTLMVQKSLQTATKLCIIHIHADIAHISTISDFSLIF